MLPFLKKSKEAGASGPVETIEREPDDGSSFDSMDAAAQDLIDAVHSKDVKSVASALRSAFELCEEQPHSEGPEIGEQ